MKIILTCIMCLLLINDNLYAQSDSSAYELQRNKINKLLDDRSNKFGQYESSLGKRTGIFGLKTKRDMQFSNDILRQIALTDNDIFSELKILLDYKDFEKKEVELRAETVEGRTERYQETITRLQKENEKLRTAFEKKDTDEESFLLYTVLLFFALLISLFYTYRLKNLRNTDNSTSKLPK